MYRRKILTLVALFMVTLSTIFASTNTYERTAENLQIWDSINITSTVKSAALKTPKVDENEKIYDFAELLSNEEELSLYNDITEFISTYNMDMVVVTIDNNNKYDAKNYADDFYDYNYFGKGTTRDGILLLIDMDTREVWISTTGQAILIYNDSRIDNMLDYIAPKLTSKNYIGSVDKFIYYSEYYASLGVPSNNQDYYIDEKGEYKKSNSIFANVDKAILFSSIITVVFIIIGVSKHRNVKKARKAKLYLVKDSLKISNKSDKFINSTTTKTRIESSSSSSGGGGSSTHHSSSGSSHGGGGRGF